jgi:ribosomal protein L11 methyltransferase
MSEATSVEWVEVSLTVSGELAEAVAEAFARIAGTRVATEQGVTHLDAEDEGTADGPVIVRAYLAADEHVESARRSIEDALRALGMIHSLPAAVFRLMPEQNWMEAWKQHYRPIPIGKRLLIVPAWLDAPDPARIAVKIEPGMAFGTGTHPSTQLCLELLERASGDYVGGATPGSGSSFIDIGCGSGILSVAALRLGATRAVAVDIDSQSIENTRHNAELNGILQGLEVGTGSVTEVLGGRFGMSSAKIVAVNILATVIIRLFAAGLRSLVEEDGQLILGGILENQADDVLRTAVAAGLRLKVRRQRGDWVAFLMQPNRQRASP